MKTLKEALFSRKNIKHVELPYRLKEEDLKGDIKNLPMGVVVRMMEEQELQGNEPDVKVFQDDYTSNRNNGGFDWDRTEAGRSFWINFIFDEEWDKFFKRYPEYYKYNLG